MYKKAASFLYYHDLDVYRTQKTCENVKEKKAELSVYTTSSTALARIPHSFSCPRIAALPLHLHAAP